MVVQVHYVLQIALGHPKAPGSLPETYILPEHSNLNHISTLGGSFIFKKTVIDLTKSCKPHFCGVQMYIFEGEIHLLWSRFQANRQQIMGTWQCNKSPVCQNTNECVFSPLQNSVIFFSYWVGRGERERFR